MQKKSFDSLKKTLVKLDFRREWIPEFIRYIEQTIEKGAILLILFGSRAKKEFLKDSDIDVLIVSNKLQSDSRERALEFFSDKLPVQPFVLSPSELEERIEKLDLLIFDALEDGIVLYSDMNMAHVHDVVRASKERFKLERVKNGWKFDAAEAAAAGI